MARIRHNGRTGKKKPPLSPSKTETQAEPRANLDERPSGSPASGKPGRPGAELPPVFKTFADTTSHVVKQAASILEEEIAAGILAARQIEDKFIDTAELRSGKPDEVLQRFRRDAHEVVDIVLDVVSATARNATNMAQRVISIRSSQRNTPETASTSVLSMPEPVEPGQTGEVSLVIENDGDGTTEPFELRCTDLISGSGLRIGSGAVSFDPKVITVGSHQTQRVLVRVAPPVGIAPGVYSGLIQSSRPDQLRAVLSVTVA
jgi:hypothetical protein